MYWYQQRDEALKKLGFKSYGKYLSSKLWKKIRSKILNRCRGKCEVCLFNRPTQVHHRSYFIDVMRGKRLDLLVGCCRNCHEEAEFDRSRKVSPKEANYRMKQRVEKNGHTLYGICVLCRKNPTGRNKEICGRCKREVDSAYLVGTGNEWENYCKQHLDSI